MALLKPAEPAPEGALDKPAVAPVGALDKEPAAPAAPEPRALRVLRGIWDLICEHWFILGLGFAIGFAAAVPDFGRNGGWVAAQWSIKYGAVIVIFFLSGCSLKTKALVTAAARVHFHLFIQFICLVLTPAIGYGIARALMESGIDRNLVNGLVVAMAMPTTISTNVVFTKQSGGNEAAALINAVIGNIIGIFISPAWLTLYLGESGQAPYGDVIKQLAVTIIAPLIVGQLFQFFLPALVKWAQDRVNFGKIGNVMIILLVWNTFCNTFHKKVELGAGSWVPMLFLEIGLFLSFSAMCLALGTFAPLKRLFKLDKPDAVAVIMCGSTKTLALGMPLITVLYGKTSFAGIISLPLLIYHATQCLLGSLMIKHLKQWVNDEKRPGAWPASCVPPTGPDPAAGPDEEAPFNSAAPEKSTGRANGAAVAPPADDRVASGGGKDAAAAEHWLPPERVHPGTADPERGQAPRS
ncbi:Sodium/bile acid cotransporter 7 [Tetrabaena socialis]|uniref:Sodium/bile acid cotransporter 7 n=1 Tax=Tetrabaena socialis TaxID=47790 RepID=A0A2J8AFF4_9CHLO|nr:Sodium/bile acid cotransporter 7 [Tetrabaena socialis]|eukprot:PNH11236.1 Sodium/bile acid cotransporter 7 [Tetrabaena socialis]